MKSKSVEKYLLFFLSAFIVSYVYQAIMCVSGVLFLLFSLSFHCNFSRFIQCHLSELNDRIGHFVNGGKHPFSCCIQNSVYHIFRLFVLLRVFFNYNIFTNRTAQIIA